MNSNFDSGSSNSRVFANSSASTAIPGRSSNISECPQRPPARHMQAVTIPSSGSLKSAVKFPAASGSGSSSNNSNNINPAAVAAATVAALPVSKAFLSPSASKKKPVSLGGVGGSGGGGPVFSTLQLEFDCRSTSNHNSILSGNSSTRNKTMNQQRDFKPTVAADTEKSLSTSSRSIVMRMNDESAFSESSTLEGSDFLTLASLCISDKTNSSTTGANAVGAMAMNVRQRARLSAQQQMNTTISGSDTGSSRLTSVSELTPNSQALPGRGRNNQNHIRRTNSSGTGRFSANTLSSGSWVGGGGGGTPSTKSSTSMNKAGDTPPSQPPRQRNRPKHSKSMPSAGFAAFPLEDLKEDLDDDDDGDSTSSCIELGGSSSNIDGSSGSDDKSVMSISAKKLLERKQRKATSSLLRRKSHRDLLDETDQALLPGSPQTSPAAPPTMPVRRPPSPTSAAIAVAVAPKTKTTLSSNPPTKPIRRGLSPVHSNTEIKTTATNAEETTIPNAPADGVDQSQSSHQSEDHSLSYEDGHSLHLHHYDGQSVVSALTYDDESTVTSYTPSTPGSFWKNKTQEQSAYAQYHNSRPPQRSTSGPNVDGRAGPPNKALHHVSKEDVRKAMMQNMHMSLPSHSHFMSLPLREEDEHDMTSQSDGDVSLSAKKLVAKQQQQQEQQQPGLAPSQYPQYKDALPPSTRNMPPGVATNDKDVGFGRRNMMQKAKSVSHINNNSSSLEHRLMALPARTKSSGKEVMALKLQQQALQQQQQVGLLASKNPPQMPVRSGASIIDDATLTSEILKKRQASGRLPEDRTRSLSPTSRSSRWNTGAAGDLSERSNKDKTRMTTPGNAAAGSDWQLTDGTAPNDKQLLFHRTLSNPSSTMATKTANPPTTRGFGLPPRNGLQLRPAMGLSRSMSTPNLVNTEEEAATAGATGGSVSGSHALPSEKIESIVSFLLGKGINSPASQSAEAKAGATAKSGDGEVSKLAAEQIVAKVSSDLPSKQMEDDSLRLKDLASQGGSASTEGPTATLEPPKLLAAPSQGSGELIRGWNNEEPGTASESQPATEEPESEEMPVFQEWEAEQASKGIMGTLKKQIKTVGKASKYLRKKANSFAVTDKDEIANLSTSMSAFEFHTNTPATGAFHMERLEDLPDEEVSEEFGGNTEMPETAVETKRKKKSLDEDKTASTSAAKASNTKQKKDSVAPKTRSLGKKFQFMRAASVPNLSASQRGSSSKRGGLSEDKNAEEGSLVGEKELNDKESVAEKSKAKPTSPRVSPKQTLSPAPASGSGRTYTKRRTRNMKTPSIRNLDATECVSSRAAPKLQANAKDSAPIKFDVDPSIEKTKTTPEGMKPRMSNKLQSNLKDSATIKFDADTSSSAENIKSGAASDKPPAAEKSRRRSGKDKVGKSSKRDKKKSRSKSASARPRRDKEKKDKTRTKMSAPAKTASVRKPNFDSSMSSMSISGKKHNESITSRADETVFSLASNLKEESRKARREGRPSYRKHMSLRNVDDSASRTTVSTNSVTVSTAQSIRKLPTADPLSPNEVHSQRNFGPATPSSSRRVSRMRLARGMAQSERHIGRTKSDKPLSLLGSSDESSEDDEGNKFPPLAYSKRRSMSQSRQRSRRSLQSGSRKQMSSRTLNISDESTTGSGDGIAKAQPKLKSSLKTTKTATAPKTSRGVRTNMKKAQSLRNLGY